jgi:GTP-binding protein
VTALPRDGLPQIALVGRSNVGKSTLINALTGRAIARTSATPGKTRLANLYRVHLQGGNPDASGAPGSWRMYLVDLPGYGYARASRSARGQFAAVTGAYFSGSESAGQREAQEGSAEGAVGPRERRRMPAGALLVIDARHPALDSDLAAREWLDALGVPYEIVATKVDKLSRNARAGALRAVGQQHNRPALPVSAVAGEGLDELWKQIVKLASR